MVYGLEVFREYFGAYSNQYVFIGGTACDILMDDLGVSFRATKDLDIVLIIEALDASFGEQFWRFIEDGGYEHKSKSDGKDQFYRFSKPAKFGYPAMIELFGRKSNKFEMKFETGLTPIHLDDNVSSLSAILLNDEYYNLLTSRKRTVDGFSVIEIEILILFKIKAWLDMKEKLDLGDKVDSKNIKKHKNDVFRLLENVTPSNRIRVVKEIEKDIRLFIGKITLDKPSLNDIGIRGASFSEMIELLENIYLRP